MIPLRETSSAARGPPAALLARRASTLVTRCASASAASFVRAFRRAPRTWFVGLLMAQLLLPALAVGTGKKNKMLAAYPTIFKFFMFWWCTFVACVMLVYVVDHLLSKYKGPSRVDYTVEHTFRGSADREAIWAQLVDPSAWAPSHPVLQSADIRMVECGDVSKDSEDAGKEKTSSSPPAEEGSAAAVTAAAAAEGEAENAVTRTVRPVPLGCLKPGLGMILRYKEGNWRAGLHFCTRECTALQIPGPKQPWQILMRTVDVGGGYPYLRDTEEVMVELHPPAEDGSMLCALVGRAACQSRFFRWWSGLQKNSELGAAAYFDAIAEEIGRSKKSD